jgi:heme-degrading monooxygenase HmoA
MIRHIVPFRLKHAKGSAEEAGFLAASHKLADIPGVEQFELLRQISPKNDFDFCVSMAFADQAAYQAYNDHPDHIAFVQTRWLPEVADFMEIDLNAEQA